MPEPIFAITIRQPWAWAITRGKDVENRSWKTEYRGLVAIHAGSRARWDHDGQRCPLVRRAWVDYVRSRPEGTTCRVLNRDTPNMPFGAVVALAEVTGTHLDAECADLSCGWVTYCSPWAARDSCHWTLGSVHALAKPVPVRGQLGLWHLPPDVEEAVRNTPLIGAAV